MNIKFEKNTIRKKETIVLAVLLVIVIGVAYFVEKIYRPNIFTLGMEKKEVLRMLREDYKIEPRYIGSISIEAWPRYDYIPTDAQKMLEMEEIPKHLKNARLIFYYFNRVGNQLEEKILVCCGYYKLTDIDDTRTALRLWLHENGRLDQEPTKEGTLRHGGFFRTYREGNTCVVYTSSINPKMSKYHAVNTKEYMTVEHAIKQNLL